MMMLDRWNTRIKMIASLFLSAIPLSLSLSLPSPYNSSETSLFLFFSPIFFPLHKPPSLLLTSFSLFYLHLHLRLSNFKLSLFSRSLEFTHKLSKLGETRAKRTKSARLFMDLNRSLAHFDGLPEDKWLVDWISDSIDPPFPFESDTLQFLQTFVSFRFVSYRFVSFRPCRSTQSISRRTAPRLRNIVSLSLEEELSVSVSRRSD